MNTCPHCGSKALDEAIRGAEKSVFRCLFCWKLFAAPALSRSAEDPDAMIGAPNSDEQLAQPASRITTT